MEPLAVTIKVAREALGLGTTKIYELIAEGRLETLKVGRRTLVKVQSMHDFVAGTIDVQS